MSSNSYIAEAATRHSVFLQRYGGGIALDQKEVITEMAEAVRNLLLGELTQTRRKRLTTIYKQLQTIINASIATMNADVTAQLNDLAVYEADFNLRLLNGAVNVEFAAIQPSVIRAMVSDTEMNLVSGQKITTGTLDDLYKTFSETTYKQVRSIVRNGIASGMNAEEMARDAYKLVNNRTRAQSKSLVLTAANHIGQEAMNELGNANRDIASMDRYIATLDSRTTIQCSGFDGQTYKPKEGPFPPIHYRCRSRRVPKVDDKFSLQIEGTRASYEGPVSNKLTYSGFLKGQSKEFQDEVLGVERAKLFRSGAVTLDKFTDDDNRVIPLSRLRELEGLTL